MTEASMAEGGKKGKNKFAVGLQIYADAVLGDVKTREKTASIQGLCLRPGRRRKGDAGGNRAVFKIVCPIRIPSDYSDYSDYSNPPLTIRFSNHEKAER